MREVVISGSGLWKPEYTITNEELVSSYNTWAEAFNFENAVAIAGGGLSAKPFSSAEFVEKASGIKSRYVYRKEGILDINRMRPKIDRRGDDEVSHQAFTNKYNLNFPLLADTQKSIITAYDVDGGGYAKRVTYIIDGNGKIIDVDAAVNTTTQASDVLAKLGL